MPSPRASALPGIGTDRSRNRNTRRRSASLGLLAAREFRVRVAGEDGHPLELYRGPSPIRSPSDRRVRDDDSRSPCGWRNGGDDGARTSGLAQGHALPSRSREFRVVTERFSDERASRIHIDSQPSRGSPGSRVEWGGMGWGGTADRRVRGFERVREDGFVKTALSPSRENQYVAGDSSDNCVDKRCEILPFVDLLEGSFRFFR